MCRIMKIGVLIKTIPNTESHIDINVKKLDINKNSIDFIINPNDEYAIEEAVQYKEKYNDAEVIIITFGSTYSEKAIRNALATGADKALIIDNGSYSVFENKIAQAVILKKIILENSIDFIITGKETGDDQDSISPSMIASALGWHQAMNTIKIEYLDKNLKAKRMVGSTLSETVNLTLPCVVSVRKGINNPRYPSIINIMKSKNKEIVWYNFEELLFENFSKDEICPFIIKSLEYFQPKKEGIMIKCDNIENICIKISDYLKSKV